MNMKVCICIPHNHSHFLKEFTMSLLAVQYTFLDWQRVSGRNDKLSIITQDGVRLDTSRNELVNTALANDQDFIFFMDSDQDFPADVIQTMLGDFEDNPEIEAVTGLYTWKKPPFVPHVYHSYDRKTKKYNIAAKFPLNELFRVEGAGTGCLMVKRGVFERTPRPWFKFGAYKNSLPMGEDLYFCYKAKPLILCDPRIKSGHYTRARFTIDDYISSNGLERYEEFEATPEQVARMGVMQEGNIGKRLDDLDNDDKA